jgi:hypothetical protein
MPRFARNLAAVLVWEVLWGFGNACTASAIFVPFLSQLGGSKRIVGNVGLTMLLGVPALVVSLWLDHRLRRRRVAVAILWAAQFASWIAIGAMLIDGKPPSPLLVPIIYVSQSVFAFLAGVAMAPTYQLLTSVFGDRFATAQGLQLLFRQVSGVVGGLWVASALARHPYPRNFGVAFLVGGIILTASNAAVLLFVEGSSSATAEPFVPTLRRALASARKVASLFWVIACVATAISVQTFLVVSMLERLRLGPGYAGVFESVTLATSGVGGAIAGRAGDRFGHARALVAAFAIQIVAFALVVKLSGLGQAWIALGLAGVAQAAMLIGLAGLTVKLAPEDARGGFMAIMRWITQIVSALATAAAAFVVDRVGYALLFGVSALMVLATIPLLPRLGRSAPA